MSLAFNIYMGFLLIWLSLGILGLIIGYYCETLEIKLSMIPKGILLGPVTFLIAIS